MPHSTKILSQAGISLADTYDIQGSIAGLEELDATSVKTVHEMGATIFSERLSGQILRAEPAAMAQSTSTSAALANFSAVATRILGIQVLVDVTARMLRCAVVARAVRAPIQEIPIWVWDATNEDSITMSDDGAGPANKIFLRPSATYTANPTLLIGSNQPVIVDQLVMRCSSNAFGAGTVTPTMIVYVAFAGLGGLSAAGLPIPGW